MPKPDTQARKWIPPVLHPSVSGMQQWNFARLRPEDLIALLDFAADHCCCEAEGKESLTSVDIALKRATS